MPHFDADAEQNLPFIRHTMDKAVLEETMLGR